MKFSLILPFHNADAAKILDTVPKIAKEAEQHDVVEVILAHNGAPLQNQHVRQTESVLVKFYHTDVKGLGAGYKLGIEKAKSDYLVLSASDLPFGWTDIDNFRRLHPGEFAIGSKAHPQSVVTGLSFKRRLASNFFYLARRVILGPGTPGDSQGSLIISRQLAVRLCGEAVFNNYLFSLELVTRQLFSGGVVHEIPVVLQQDDKPSSVSLSQDGWQMFKGLWALRRMLKGKR